MNQGLSFVFLDNPAGDDLIIYKILLKKLTWFLTQRARIFRKISLSFAATTCHAKQYISVYLFSYF